MKRVTKLADGTSYIDFFLMLQRYKHKPTIAFAAQMDEEFEVETLEGVMRGQAGDYLVRGIKGEYYPVRKDIFEESYISSRSPDDYYKTQKTCGHCLHYEPVPSGKAHYGKCHKTGDELVHTRRSACTFFEEK